MLLLTLRGEVSGDGVVVIVVQRKTEHAIFGMNIQKIVCLRSATRDGTPMPRQGPGHMSDAVAAKPPEKCFRYVRRGDEAVILRKKCPFDMPSRNDSSLPTITDFRNPCAKFTKTRLTFWTSRRHSCTTGNCATRIRVRVHASMVKDESARASMRRRLIMKELPQFGGHKAP
jgi:hypothetical protein